MAELPGLSLRHPPRTGLDNQNVSSLLVVYEDMLATSLELENFLHGNKSNAVTRIQPWGLPVPSACELGASGFVCDLKRASQDLCCGLDEPEVCATGSAT